jgi:hypothetical protein
MTTTTTATSRAYATARRSGDGGALEAVAGGPCPLCEQPMDPAGHRCPRWN